MTRFNRGIYLRKIKESDIHENFNIWISDLKTLVKIVYKIEGEFELAPVERYVRKPDHALYGINKKDPYVIFIDYTLVVEKHDILKMGTYRAIGREDLGKLLPNDKILEVNKRAKGLIVTLFLPAKILMDLANLIGVDIISLQNGLKVDDISNSGAVLTIAGIMYRILHTNEEWESIVELFRERWISLKQQEDRSVLMITPILIGHYIRTKTIGKKQMKRLIAIKNNIIGVMDMQMSEVEYLITEIIRTYSNDEEREMMIQRILRGLTPEQKQIVLAALEGLSPEQQQIVLAALKGLSPEQQQIVLATISQLSPEQNKILMMLINLMIKEPEKFKELEKLFSQK